MAVYFTTAFGILPGTVYKSCGNYPDPEKGVTRVIVAYFVRPFRFIHDEYPGFPLERARFDEQVGDIIRFKKIMT